MAPKNILITGAGGFVGQILAQKLLSSPDYKVTLADIFEPPIPQTAHAANGTAIAANLCDASALAKLLQPNLDAIYLFHGIMSSASEANYELGLSVNLESTRALLEHIRVHIAPTRSTPLRVIYAASGAIYGQPLPLSGVITDAVTPTPESSYGTQKLMCELLINDMSRRGFIDGLSLRFPTISVRAGKPTAAASSFLSGMVREPLNGLECVLPIEDRKFRAFLCAPRVLVENLVIALGVDTGKLRPHMRGVNLPGTSTSVEEMVEALREAGGDEAVARLKFERDPVMERILLSWAVDYDTRTAEGLGFMKDDGFKAAVRGYKEGLGQQS